MKWLGLNRGRQTAPEMDKPQADCWSKSKIDVRQADAERTQTVHNIELQAMFDSGGHEQNPRDNVRDRGSACDDGEENIGSTCVATRRDEVKASKDGHEQAEENDRPDELKYRARLDLWWCIPGSATSGHCAADKGQDGK